MTNDAKTQHTPGPWRIVAHLPIKQMDGPYQVCALDGSKTVARVPSKTSTRPELDDGQEAYANARLIAAAPELLAVVSGFLEVQADDISKTVNGAEFFSMLAHARAAIAKATGGTL